MYNYKENKAIDDEPATCSLSTVGLGNVRLKMRAYKTKMGNSRTVFDVALPCCLSLCIFVRHYTYSRRHSDVRVCRVRVRRQ